MFSANKEMRCFARIGTICTIGGVLILVEVQAFTKSNTPPWVFFMFFKLHKWYQIAQRIKFEILQQASPWLGINFNMLNFNPLTTNFSTFHIETPVN